MLYVAGELTATKQEGFVVIHDDQGKVFMMTVKAANELIVNLELAVDE